MAIFIMMIINDLRYTDIHIWTGKNFACILAIMPFTKSGLAGKKEEDYQWKILIGKC